MYSARLAVFTDTNALKLCSNLRGRSFVSFVYNSMKCSSLPLSHQAVTFNHSEFCLQMYCWLLYTEMLSRKQQTSKNPSNQQLCHRRPFQALANNHSPLPSGLTYCAHKINKQIFRTAQVIKFINSDISYVTIEALLVMAGVSGSQGNHVKIGRSSFFVQPLYI